MSTQHLILYVFIPSEGTDKDSVCQKMQVKTVKVKTVIKTLIVIVNLIGAELDTNCSIQADMNSQAVTNKSSPYTCYSSISRCNPL